MKSKIAEAIHLATQPVAVIWSDNPPDDAIEFKPGKFGCVVTLFATAATRERAGKFSRETFGCWGGGVGVGFGNCYGDFPVGVEGLCYFLSEGNEKTEQGRAIGGQLKDAGAGRIAETFMHGERYVKDAELTQNFVDELPMMEVPTKYVVVKPLSQVDPDRDDVQNISFFVNPDQLSALVILANYARQGMDNVVMTYAAACQVMGILAYRESKRDHPRGLVGMTDISARNNVRASLGKDILSFTAPMSLFYEMESHVEGSFLEDHQWKALLEHCSPFVIFGWTKPRHGLSFGCSHGRIVDGRRCSEATS